MERRRNNGYESMSKEELILQLNDHKKKIKSLEGKMRTSEQLVLKLRYELNQHEELIEILREKKAKNRASRTLEEESSLNEYGDLFDKKFVAKASESNDEEYRGHRSKSRGRESVRGKRKILKHKHKSSAARVERAKKKRQDNRKKSGKTRKMSEHNTKSTRGKSTAARKKSDGWDLYQDRKSSVGTATSNDPTKEVRKESVQALLSVSSPPFKSKQEDKGKDELDDSAPRAKSPVVSFFLDPSFFSFSSH